MTALRALVRRYPVAAVAVIVGVVGLGGWMFYQSRQSQEQPRAVAPPITPPIGTPVTPTAAVGSPTAVTPTSPAGAARPVTPTPTVRGGAASPSAPGQTGPGQGGAPPVPSGEGRANPFQPLATPGGGVTLPPVPPLPATGPAGPGQATGPLTPSAPPAPEYRLVGLLWGDRAFVILEDSQGSYIVGPGDTVRPGVRVVAIDVRREAVRLDRDGTPIDLTLSVAVRRSP